MEPTIQKVDENVSGYPEDAEVQHCKLQFECAKRWGDLQQTDNPKVRFCNACSTSVFFCSTAQEIIAAILNKTCVAFVARKCDKTFTRLLMGVPSATS